MLDLNAAIPQNSGWMLIEARGISDNGKIAGYGTINGVQHAYLLTPSLVSQTVTFDPIANKTLRQCAVHDQRDGLIKLAGNLQRGVPDRRR
jgi:probable HAF family extracellular repeat protein